jgi:hypothetical protein
MRFSAAVLFLACFPAMGSVWVSTGQTTAQTQIDLDHSTTWQFTPVLEFTFSGGRFIMKDGPSTVASISFSVYEGLNANGLLLAQLTLTNDDFCVGQDNCQNYGLHTFDLGTQSVAMQIGRNYFIALTSPTANDKQSQAYFIKGPDLITFTDANGNPYNPPPAMIGTVPEPSTGLLLGAGVALAFTLKKYRRRQAAAKSH